MKKSRKIAAVVCLAAFSHLVLLPAIEVGTPLMVRAVAPVAMIAGVAVPILPELGIVEAQTVAQSGQSTHSNPSGVLTGSWSSADSVFYVTPNDGTGVPQITDVSRDRDQLWRYTNAIQSTLKGGTRDSSQVLSFQGARSVYMSVFATCDSACGAVLLGIQMRRHVVSSADSLSAMPVWRWGNVATVGLGDSMNSSPSVLIGAGLSNDSTLMANEFGLWVPGPMVSAIPRTMTFQLLDRNGNPIDPSPYFSIRVRPVLFKNPSGAAAAHPYTSRRVAVQIGLYGTR